MEQTKLKKFNEKYFKDRPGALHFCNNCDLKNFLYCSDCADKLINRLDKIMDKPEPIPEPIQLGRPRNLINNSKVVSEDTTLMESEDSIKKPPKTRNLKEYNKKYYQENKSKFENYYQESRKPGFIPKWHRRKNQIRIKAEEATEQHNPRQNSA